MATCYFQDLAASDYAWTTVANWWTDAACTVAKGSLPIAGDTIYIAGRMDSGPATSIAFAHIHVANYDTGGGSFQVDFTGATGPATFNLSYNAGTITGDCTFDNLSANMGTITGDCTFNGSYNAGTITGDCTFNGSYNAGTITGDCTFNGSYNNGTITGDCTFDNLSANNGTITGDCTFDGGSYNNNGGTIGGACTFNDSSYNGGTIFGSAWFGFGTSCTGGAYSFDYASGAVLKNVDIIGAYDGNLLYYRSFTVDYPRTDILGTGLL